MPKKLKKKLNKYYNIDKTIIIRAKNAEKAAKKLYRINKNIIDICVIDIENNIYNFNSNNWTNRKNNKFISKKRNTYIKKY